MRSSTPVFRLDARRRPRVPSINSFSGDRRGAAGEPERGDETTTERRARTAAPAAAARVNGAPPAASPPAPRPGRPRNLHRHERYAALARAGDQMPRRHRCQWAATSQAVVPVFCASQGRPTPTPAASHAILFHRSTLYPRMPGGWCQPATPSPSSLVRRSFREHRVGFGARTALPYGVLRGASRERRGRGDTSSCSRA